VLALRGGGDETLHEGIAAIQRELAVSADFPAEVEAAAVQAATSPRLPELDRTDLEFVTIDPAGSMDLDQAMHLEKSAHGYVVRYAIADVAAFVAPDGPIDLEARRRGESLYGANATIPLHPKVLSEGAASLLPGEVRPALMWTIELDHEGELTQAVVERARIRSRQRLDYETVQKSIDDGTAGDDMKLLKEIGELRIAVERERGGVNLPVPEQEILVVDGSWSLEYRTVLPVEEWNAQISLLTGFAAASIMMHGRVGVLRTLPPPAPESIKRLHRTAAALGVSWPAEELYPDFIRALDPSKPVEAAMAVACTTLLRGAGYVGFDGETPEQPEHAALASEYAHVTAPLRRLVDRYGLEVCAALCADQPVPSWVHDRLHELPEIMQASSRRAHQYENAIVSLVEAAILHPHVGESFPGVVLDVDDEDPTRGDFMVREPAIEGKISGDGLTAGAGMTATLAHADPATRTVRFAV
jgi:exoribonuclease R